jgi:hypothetical protein
MKCISVSRTSTEIESAIVSRKGSKVMMLTLNRIRYWSVQQQCGTNVRLLDTNRVCSGVQNGKLVADGTRERCFQLSITYLVRQLADQQKAPQGAFWYLQKNMGVVFSSSEEVLF